MVRYANPYANDKYRRHVARGFCPSIHRSKAWCSKQAEHFGSHHAPRLDGTKLVWDDRDEHPGRPK